MKFLSLLLEKGPLSEEERGWAVYCAAKSKDLERLQAFLVDGPISQSKRGFALWTAVEDQNSLPIVKAPLKSGPISKEDLALAVKKAKQNPQVRAALATNNSQCAIS